MTAKPIIETIQGQVDDNVIDLGVGHPKTSHLPIGRLYQAVQKRFAAGDPYFLQYGVEQGDGYLRFDLASFLSQGYEMDIIPEGILITCGASSGLDLACTLFTNPGDIVFVEEPTYFLALKVFADHQLKPVAINVNEDGLILDALEVALKKYQPKIVYTVPTFQNPGGCTLSAERRERLVQLSREHDFLILADEVYHFLHYANPPPKAMAAYINQGNVLSLGSFSKILAPGLRMGWILTDQDRLQKLVNSGLLASGGGMNPFASAMVRALLENGQLEANILDLRVDYHQRMLVMEAALRNHLPETRFRRPEGGYFYWVEFPGGCDAEKLLDHAQGYQVSYKPGRRFSSRGELSSFARLCFTYYEPPELEEGIQRLGQALNSFLGG